MYNRTTIGAAIIAKNEEKNIQRCLQSIQNICSQIVVVDTGSGDATPVLAAKQGAEVFFHKWQNSFAEARNFAIRHLWTDWILYIDADEELADAASFAEQLHKAIALGVSATVGGVSVVLNNFLDENLSTAKQHRFTRIFINDKRIHFTGKIHEQIADSITEVNYAIVESDIVINHYGYIGKNPEKELRNKQLLEEESKSNDDIYVQFHLANTEFSMGSYMEALELFQKIVDSKELSALQNEEVKIKMGQIYLAQNQFDRTIDCLNFTASNTDNEGLRLSIIGAAYLHKQEFTKAKEIYNRSEVITSKLVNIDIVDKAQQVFQLLSI